MESLLISLVTMAAVILIVNKRAGSPRDRDVVSLDAAESGFSITSESKEHKSCVKATGAIPVILIAILLFLFAAVRYRAIFASGSVSRQPVGDGLIGIYGAIPLPQSLWLAQNLSGDTEILFRQGLAQLYNFNQIEARRNFAAALESDGKCWMCVWGIAHSHGSTVNAPMSEQSCNLGRLSIERISAHDQELAALPRLLLKAQQRRYSCCAQSGNWTRQGGVMACEQAYATAMADIIDAFPNNADMLCQYADSLLNLIPWDYYKVIGSLRALVPVAQQAHNAVAKGLEIDPLNLLCLHLAIHIYEPSSSPEHGEVVADTLASLTVASKLGHLIHMPSHIYDRIGRYEDSINCNKLAIKCNEAYISIGLVPYVPEHNKAMLVASALNSGSLGISLRYSRSCQESDPRSGLTLTSSFAAQKARLNYSFNANKI